MKTKMSKLDKEILLMNYKIHAESPYNDGWTQDFYREQYNKLKKKLEKKKK